MRARIYQPAKTAMQSGMAKTERWVLEYEADQPGEIDPLMGWFSSGNTQAQVHLYFSSVKEAEAYAISKGLAYDITLGHVRKHMIRANGYGENFATNRKNVWTH